MKIISRLLADLRRATVDRLTIPLSNLGDKDLTLIVQLAFLGILGRPADPAALQCFKAHLRNGMSIENLKNILAGSEEARGLPVMEAEGGHIKFTMLGTDRSLTKELWDKRLAETEAQGTTTTRQPATPFVHSGQYDVTAIASIYKAGRFIEQLLENITSQTIFDRSELIIVDANSPEAEAEIIRKYQEKFPNIIYHRINYRIGIYDAWNVGVELARGRYLTNTNADDLRRSDSFEIQATALDANPLADIVYQNFYYTFDPFLTFEQVARIGFVSDVPPISASNLIQFNSPHNAPMWRRELHSDVGLFDTSFKSAGDWEFWLRCLTRGRRFHRIETPHVSYYHNPEGISTRADTRAIEETRWIHMRYRRLADEAL